MLGGPVMDLNKRFLVFLICIQCFFCIGSK